MGTGLLNKKLVVRFQPKELVLWLFIILYPILPDYTRIGGQPVYIYTAFLFGCYILLLFLRDFYRTINVSRVKSLWYVLTVTGIIAVSYVAHSEYVQFVKYFIEFFAVIYGVCRLINSEERFEKAIDVVIATSSIMCIFAFIEFLFGFNVFSLIENHYYDNLIFGSGSEPRMGMNRVELSFNTAISCCIYFGICLCLSAYKLNNAIHAYKRRRYLVSFFLLNIGACTTLSRGPLIFIALMDLIFLFSFERRVKRKVVGLLVAALFVGMLATVIFDINIFQLFSSVFGAILALFDDNYKGSISDSFGTNLDPFKYRLGLFDATFELIKDRPLVGCGMSDNRQFYVNGWLSYSIDNGYLSRLYRQGWIGLLSFLVYLGYPILSCLKRLGRTCSKKSFYLYIMSGVVFYACSLFTVAVISEYRIVYVAIGLFFAYINLDKSCQTSLRSKSV